MGKAMMFDLADSLDGSRLLNDKVDEVKRVTSTIVPVEIILLFMLSNGARFFMQR